MNYRKKKLDKEFELRIELPSRRAEKKHLRKSGSVATGTEEVEKKSG